MNQTQKNSLIFLNSLIHPEKFSKKKQTTVRKSRKNIFLIILTIITFFAILSHHIYRFANQSLSLSSTCIFRCHSLDFFSPPPPPPPPPLPPSKPLFPLQLPPLPPSKGSSTEAIFIPDWEVLVIVPPETPLVPPLENNYLYIYPDKSLTPAKFANFPAVNRRHLPFFQLALVRIEERENLDPFLPPSKFLLRWNFIVYDSFTTENDVVLLVKGVNNRQGSSRPPSNFCCVLGHDSLTPVKTNVTSSSQEVFHCNRPGITGSRSIPVTIEIVEDDRTAVIIPSLAKYVPDNQCTIMQFERKSLICACTMVNNVGKFLREWVTFHAKIGVEKFILYDNDNEDDLGAQVEGLRNEGFDVRTVYWVWPKAQDARFSRCALYSARICDWVVFVDIDEFFLSPSWLESPRPRVDMLRELLLERPEVERVGQVLIRCNEFGPSNQTAHRLMG